MIKFSLKLAVFLIYLLSSAAHAGLIDESGVWVCDDPEDEVCIISDVIPEEFYIVKGQFQWVWASYVNTEFYDGNQLMSPEDFHLNEGWRFATTNEELFELSELTLSDFTNDNGSLIEAAIYWNTRYMGVDSLNLDDSDISSVWVSNVHDNFFFDTFYVRNTPAQVPEPTTIMIFAIALIALSMRNRVIQ
ncbi:MULTISPECIES: PEP-CTERM sorting domain-containing protein [unclassified Colwellia]|uniref:PEP-CTERM sorting domain-containing protein n=1 Tax=unclassified Colwellia TaxID=196834 RepID=UPI0015F63D52|nr:MULTISPECIES: PEP-CTERM sorting domain-containing protein [unclassified Colwellia]MBA6348450.1 PEP-CTERM sorting domain-containing protein [Colwellia sp. BRX8-9]MBA6369820.1 PEP-CTERM sorting domain-containing protein [Colwellia sp. BRX8-4]